MRWTRMIEAAIVGAAGQQHAEHACGGQGKKPVAVIHTYLQKLTRPWNGVFQNSASPAFQVGAGIGNSTSLPPSRFSLSLR
jgi:hypothetical protein